MAYIREPFVFCFRAGLQQLAVDGRLRGMDLRVLLYILGHLGWDNEIRCVQKDMSVALGVSRQSVWRSMQRLVEYGIVAQRPKFGHQPMYRLATELAYFGPLARRRQERRQVQARQRLEALAEALHEGQALDITQVVR